jgi:hypothetical protein
VPKEELLMLLALLLALLLELYHRLLRVPLELPALHHRLLRVPLEQLVLRLVPLLVLHLDLDLQRLWLYLFENLS